MVGQLPGRQRVSRQFTCPQRRPGRWAGYRRSDVGAM